MLSLTKKSHGESKRSEPTDGKFHLCLKTLPDGAANDPGTGAAPTGCQVGSIGCDELPELPRHRSGFPNEGIGSSGDRHLNDFAESVDVNVGGSHMEMSSPSMKYASVGGPIVVRGRESRLQGEGGQGIDTQWTK
jgi:hypothetical protein